MFPTVPMQRISSFCEWDYPTRAVSILNRYLEDFTIPEIEESVRAAYSAERFDTPEIALQTMLVSEGIFLSSQLGREVTADEIKELSVSSAMRRQETEWGTFTYLD